jgi:BirA family transcriptional regulator, biotin operon repressor / biotin---[acetyl-CoA-carboxylase] ligase
LAREGAPEGAWLRAERQTGGRGRLGRQWDSPVGNLYASTIVRLSQSDPMPATLALVAGLAAHDAISAHVTATLKWPNDVLIEDRKVSGILLERADDAVVIGFGVNLAHHPALDRPVTSIAAQTGLAPDPKVFVHDLAKHFANRLVQWRSGLATTITAWLTAAHPVGTPLCADIGNGERIDGSFAGLLPDGALQLRLADGSERAIHAGDIFLT